MCVCMNVCRYVCIVFVSEWLISSLRWWPGQICHPAIVPLNILDLPHDVGEFPVYFFGTHDYLWTHRGRLVASYI